PESVLALLRRDPLPRAHVERAPVGRAGEGLVDELGHAAQRADPLAVADLALVPDEEHRARAGGAPPSGRDADHSSPSATGGREASSQSSVAPRNSRSSAACSAR